MQRDHWRNSLITFHLGLTIALLHLFVAACGSIADVPSAIPNSRSSTAAPSAPTRPSPQISITPTPIPPPSPSPSPTSQFAVITTPNLSELSVVLSWAAPRVYQLSFSPNGGWFAVAEEDGIHRIDVSGQADELVFPGGYSFSFSGDGNALAVRTLAGPNAIYDPRDLSFVANLPTLGGCPIGYNFALNNDATVLATGWEVEGGRNVPSSSAIGVINLRARQCDVALPRIPGEIVSLGFDHEGRYLAVSTTAGTTFVWNVEENRQACSLLGVSSRFNPAESVLAVFEGRLIVLWDPATCEVVHRLGGMPEDAFPWLVAELIGISPNGSLLAAALGSRLQIWDTQAVELIYTADRAPQTFARVDFSPDGRYIVTENHEWIEGSVSSGARLLLWAVSP